MTYLDNEDAKKTYDCTFTKGEQDELSCDTTGNPICTQVGKIHQ